MDNLVTVYISRFQGAGSDPYESLWTAAGKALAAVSIDSRFEGPINGVAGFCWNGAWYKIEAEIKPWKPGE
jgi:hypothetical protein